MVDRYTKAVLTVIAVALVVLAVQGLVGPLGAQTVREPQKVQLCDSLHCAGLAPRTTMIGSNPVTTWVLPTQIDDIQKVKICDGSTCAIVDGFGSNGSLRTSPR